MPFFPLNKKFTEKPTLRGFTVGGAGHRFATATCAAATTTATSTRGFLSASGPPSLGSTRACSKCFHFGGVHTFQKKLFFFRQEPTLLLLNEKKTNNRI